jgi:choline dehydrogenase
VDKVAKASGEVLLSAGAIQSPQLLQLSGIGPAALLQKHGIPVVHDLPGVGENLQDHLQIRMIYEMNQRTTNDDLNSLCGARPSWACSGSSSAAGRWRWASTRAAAS